ncbi:MAG: hypothetical protein LBM64_00735 [Deltaproteobacteria bacterium]|jgi:pentatricopeptide repeat protein|nr:hypothetical protein [Deltaproteobacteria bacterium]
MVTQNIARARGFLKRNEVLRALEALLVAVEMFQPKKIIGKARYETEIHLRECVDDLSRHPTVHNFLKAVSKGKATTIRYSLGEEEALSNMLRVILKVLKDQEEEISLIAGDTAEMRRDNYWEKGTACLAEGQAPKGRAILRRLGEEYGHEPGVLTRIGGVLLEHKYLFEAVEFLEEAVEKFPKDSLAYSCLVKAYTELREWDKAESLYVTALKRFGQHPNTLLNLGNLYRAWGKRDKAYDVAIRLLRALPDSEEAQDLYAWADGRKRK